MGNSKRAAMFCGIGIVLIIALFNSPWVVKPDPEDENNDFRFKRRAEDNLRYRLDESEVARVHEFSLHFPVAWPATAVNPGSESTAIHEHVSQAESLQEIFIDPIEDEQRIEDCYDSKRPGSVNSGVLDSEGNQYSSGYSWINKREPNKQDYLTYSLEERVYNSVKFTVRDDGVVVLLNRKGELVALDDSLQEIWRKSSELDSELDNPEREWTLTPPQVFYNYPDNCVLLARRAPGIHDLAALFSKEGEQIWKKEFDGDQMPYRGKDGRLYTLGYHSQMLMAYTSELEPIYQKNLRVPGLVMSYVKSVHNHPVLAACSSDGTLVVRIKQSVGFGVQSGQTTNPYSYDSYNAIVVLNTDGSERWRYECNTAPISPGIADDGTVYVVCTDDSFNNYVLQFTGNGELLRRLNSAGEITRVYMLDGGERVAFEMKTAVNENLGRARNAAKHLVVLDSEFKLLKSIRYIGYYIEKRDDFERTILGDDNVMYTSGTLLEKPYIFVLQL